ncbi:MAG: T9SS type A sorting domain-containing protein [Flavobacteriales bacterium]|nr:MAG: T9SS type A sorting domain-containing protein [Flavobacteriales bacterium]
MKNRYALLFSASLIAASAQAQFITITTEQGQVVNGTTVVHNGTSDASLLTQSLRATRNGSTTINVNMRRYEISAQTGTRNYFCWGVCYDEWDAGQYPVFNAGQEAVLSMAPGVELDNFHAYHMPQGQAGQSTYRYVWYNTANSSDTAYVDITFNVGFVGIEESVRAAARLDAYPVPAVGQDIQLEFSLDRTAAGTQLVVRDMLGATQKRLSVLGAQGRMVLPASQWTAGVYFVSLERDGRVLATRRLIVAR